MSETGQGGEGERERRPPCLVAQAEEDWVVQRDSVEPDIILTRKCVYENDYRHTLSRMLQAAPEIERDNFIRRLNTLDRLFLMIENTTVYEMGKFVRKINASMGALTSMSMKWKGNVSDGWRLPALLSLVLAFLTQIIHGFGDLISKEAANEVRRHFLHWVKKQYTTDDGEVSVLPTEVERMTFCDEEEERKKEGQKGEWMEDVEKYLELPPRILTAIFALMTKTFYRNCRSRIDIKRMLEGTTMFEWFIMSRNKWMTDKIFDQDGPDIPDDVLTFAMKGGWDTMCQTVKETEEQLRKKKQEREMEREKMKERERKMGFVHIERNTGKGCIRYRSHRIYDLFASKEKGNT